MKRKQFQWQLPEEIENRLGETSYGRQRAIFEDDHLLIVLHAPPGADDTTREARVFLRTPEGKYLCNGRENGEVKLRKLLATYQERYAKLDDECEAAATAEDHFRLLEDLLPLNRTSTNLYHALQAARDHIEGDTLLIAMRDEAYEVSRNFDLLVADAKLAFDYHMAKNSEIQAAETAEATDAQHKLNILAAITFPLMAIAAIFGMNLTHGFEEETPALFWAVFAFGFITGLATKAWVTKNRVPAAKGEPGSFQDRRALPK